ncbi:MAG: deoxyribonuclease IV [Deltaproteobacteria bacterium]|nr:deoxyribonuclease IV [Deltaproteobacteria bacterium]
MLPAIGAHLSAAGGPEKILSRARAVGAEVLQLFSSNPRQWPRDRLETGELIRLGELARAVRLPLFVHAIYLINLASPDEALRRKASRALGDALFFGALVGAAGVVTHLGSHRGTGFRPACARIARSVAEASEVSRVLLERTGRFDGPPALLLEGSAGGGECVGSTVEELVAIRSAVKELGTEAGLCLDTAHLFASGRTIHTRSGLDALLEEIGDGLGPNTVRLVHLNDSKSAAGSRADRHENLWEGCLGRDGLELWVRHPALRHVPFVLEVPGFDGKGPDRKNLRRAKLMRSQATENISRRQLIRLE